MNPSTSSRREATIEDLADRIIASGRITRADENFLLKVATSDDPPTSQEMSHVKRVLDRLRMGLLKVVD